MHVYSKKGLELSHPGKSMYMYMEYAMIFLLLSVWSCEREGGGNKDRECTETSDRESTETSQCTLYVGRVLVHSLCGTSASALLIIPMHYQASQCTPYHPCWSESAR